MSIKNTQSRDSVPCWQRNKRTCNREQCDWARLRNRHETQGGWIVGSARSGWWSSSPCVEHRHCDPFLHALISQRTTINNIFNSIHDTWKAKGDRGTSCSWRRADNDFCHLLPALPHTISPCNISATSFIIILYVDASFPSPNFFPSTLNLTKFSLLSTFNIFSASFFFLFNLTCVHHVYDER